MAGARDTFWRKCSFFAASHSWVGHYTRGHVEKSGNYPGPLYMTIIGPIHCPDTPPAHQLMHSYWQWHRLLFRGRMLYQFDQLFIDLFILYFIVFCLLFLPIFTHFAQFYPMSWSSSFKDQTQVTPLPPWQRRERGFEAATTTIVLMSLFI